MPQNTFIFKNKHLLLYPKGNEGFQFLLFFSSLVNFFQASRFQLKYKEKITGKIKYTMRMEKLSWLLQSLK